MKITVKPEDLLKQLEEVIICSNSTGSNKEFPSIGKITFEGTKEGVNAYANNGNTYIRKNINIGISDVFKCTVRGTELISSISSFPKDEEVEIEFSDVSVNIYPPADPEQNQLVPLVVDEVPRVVSKYKTKTKVVLNRLTFQAVIDKCKPFIHSHFSESQAFSYVIISLEANKILSFAGDNFRFIIDEIDGENIVDVKKPLQIHIHKYHIEFLSKLISKLDGDTVELSIEENSPSNPGQIVVVSDIVEAILLGINNTVTIYDVPAILSEPYEHAFTFKVRDFALPLKGAAATHNDEAKKSQAVYGVSMVFDTKTSTLVLESGYTMKAKRKIPIIDAQTTEAKFEFKVVLQYLRDVMGAAGENDYVQFEFVNANKPMFIRFFASEKVSKEDKYREDASTGTKEKISFIVAKHV